MTGKKLGRYEIVRTLGKGAMGLVYEGHDPVLQRHVAIKTIIVDKLDAKAAEEYEVRFRTEALAAARLLHPNIVPVFDFGRDGEVAYLVMQFIDGDDLKHHLDNGEYFSPAMVVSMILDLLAALDHAHENNIVHRDVKPANMLIEKGRVKLTDFGVARIQDADAASRTQVGAAGIGTPRYMSPEQAQGQRVDSRTDLFSAGVVLYELLTGVRPFDGDNPFAVIHQIVNTLPPPPTFHNPKLPKAIDAVLAKALAKNRDDRFSSAREFALALKSAGQRLSGGAAQGPGAQPQAAPPPTAAPAPAAPARGTDSTAAGSSINLELELEYWKDIKDSDDVHDFVTFLQSFPNGKFAALAQRRLRKLGHDPDGGSKGAGTGTGQGSVPGRSSTSIGDDEETRLPGQMPILRPSGGPAGASGLGLSGTGAVVTAPPVIGTEALRIIEEAKGAAVTARASDAVAKAGELPHSTQDVSRLAEAQRVAAEAQRHVESLQREAEARRQAEEERRRREEEEARRKAAAEAEARRIEQEQREAEAKRQAEEARQREEQARRAEQERREAEARRQAEEARRQEQLRREAAEAEARRIEQEAREAKRRAEEAEAKRKADEAEAKRRAEEAEAKRKAEEAEAKRKAEAEAKRQAEEAEAKRRAQEAEAKRRAQEAEAKRRAEEAEAKRKAEEAEAKRVAEEAEAKRKAEAEARRRTDEEKRIAAEAEAKRKAAEAEAKRKAEDEKRKAEETRRFEAELEAKRAEAERKAAEARKQEEARRQAEQAAAAVVARAASGAAADLDATQGVVGLDPLRSLEQAAPVQARAATITAPVARTSEQAEPAKKSKVVPMAIAGVVALSAIGIGVKMMMGGKGESTTVASAPASVSPNPVETPARVPAPEPKAAPVVPKAVEPAPAVRETPPARNDAAEAEARRKAEEAKKAADKAEKLAAEKAAKEKAAAEKLASEKSAAEKVAKEKEKAAADKAAAEKLAADKAAADKAAKAAADKAAADKIAVDKAAAEKAAAAKAAADKAAADKLAADKAAADKAAAAAREKEEKVASAAPVSPGQLYQQARAAESSGNMNAAISAYKRAASAGSGPAAKRLYEIYSRGESGIERDMQAASSWAQVAQKNGETISGPARMR